MQFSRHFELKTQVFQNAAAYLQSGLVPSNFVHLTPESSRRLRALACWFTLLAYGRDGYADMADSHCCLASELGDRVAASSRFKLLAPVRLNGICFTVTTSDRTPVSDLERDRYLDALNGSGQLFLTPTTYRSVPAIRVSITNWRTDTGDLNIAWQATKNALSSL